ncbi:MAG: DUF1488 family protein [Rhodocyclaceae bacterium]
MSVREIIHVVGDPVAQSEAVTFRVAAEGVESAFILSRETLEDLARTSSLSPDEYIDVFYDHEGVILEGAARALAAGHAPSNDGYIVLSTHSIKS